jgi:hypothetical protein
MRTRGVVYPTFPCGHPRTEENSYVRSYLYLGRVCEAARCKTCHQENNRMWWFRKRLAG